jgi:hypothetical protein
MNAQLLLLYVSGCCLTTRSRGDGRIFHWDHRVPPSPFGISDEHRSDEKETWAVVRGLLTCRGTSHRHLHRSPQVLSYIPNYCRL